MIMKYHNRCACHASNMPRTRNYICLSRYKRHVVPMGHRQGYKSNTTMRSHMCAQHNMVHEFKQFNVYGNVTNRKNKINVQYIKLVCVVYVCKASGPKGQYIS